MNEVYYKWNDIDFKEKMGLKRKTFKVTLEKISPQVELIPTNVKPNPKSTHHQIYSVTQLSTDKEWTAEFKGFIESYKFPCVGGLDGFHIIITSKLKGYYSFKKNCTVNNVGLASHNKRLLYTALTSPGINHDASFLKSASTGTESIE